MDYGIMIVLGVIGSVFLWLLPLVDVIVDSRDAENRGAWIALTFFTGLLGALIYWAASRPQKAEVAPSPTGTPSPSSARLLKSICRNQESNVLGRLSLDGTLMAFNPMKGTSGHHTYPVSSISNVEMKKGGNRMIIQLQNGAAYTYDWAGGFSVWGELGLNSEEWRSTIMEIKALPRIQEMNERETTPLTKEELIRSAMKALDQGDKELAKRFMDQAESIS